MLESDLASQGSFDKAALGTFIVGGAFALTSAALGVWAATGTKPSVRVAPLVGRGEVGALVEIGRAHV